MGGGLGRREPPSPRGDAALLSARFPEVFRAPGRARVLSSAHSPPLADAGPRVGHLCSAPYPKPDGAHVPTAEPQPRAGRIHGGVCSVPVVHGAATATQTRARGVSSATCMRPFSKAQQPCASVGPSGACRGSSPTPRPGELTHDSTWTRHPRWPWAGKAPLSTANHSPGPSLRC